jgi:hypothetical protein
MTRTIVLTNKSIDSKRTQTVLKADSGPRSSRIVAPRCLVWVTAKGNRKLQRSFEQKAAKVSKKIVLRRSGIYGELGAQILSIYAAPTELVPNFLRHSYKDFAPTEHVPLCDLCAVQFESLAWQRNPPFGADTHTTQRRARIVD